MMTLGRLRAIEMYVQRNSTSRHLLQKCGGELIAEVKRLREALKKIEECNGLTAAIPMMIASEALREPDPGPPDIVCRRDGSREVNYEDYKDRTNAKGI